ncbi:unnamed protein product, partial [Adineta steineri]
ASLIDYIIKNGKIPDIVQDLVNTGFELYSTKDGDNGTATIPPTAFEQLFQKMELSRPYALMAYKFLTENGTKPLDADKVNSIVRAVVTSSDDAHNSHFLLPGFFKTITNKDNEKDAKDQTPPAQQDTNEKQAPSTPSQPQAGDSKEANKSPSQPETPSGQQQTDKPQQPQSPGGSQQPGKPPQPQSPGGSQQPGKPQTPTSPQPRTPTSPGKPPQPQSPGGSQQ